MKLKIEVVLLVCIGHRNVIMAVAQQVYLRSSSICGVGMFCVHNKFGFIGTTMPTSLYMYLIKSN